jgi:hypothetical protein
MKPMARNRRVAVICAGSAAAIAGSSPFFRSFHHSNFTVAAQGIFVGVLLGISIAAFIKWRRTCASAG